MRASANSRRPHQTITTSTLVLVELIDEGFAWISSKGEVAKLLWSAICAKWSAKVRACFLL